MLPWVFEISVSTRYTLILFIEKIAFDHGKPMDDHKADDDPVKKTMIAYARNSISKKWEFIGLVGMHHGDTEIQMGLKDMIKEEDGAEVDENELIEQIKTNLISSKGKFGQKISLALSTI